MAQHGQSAWIKDIHTDKVKGKYHVNALILFNDGKQVGRRDEEWKSIAALNDQCRRDVNQYMKQRAAKGKAIDSDLYDDGQDAKFRQTENLGFPTHYGDEENAGYWNKKAVNLNQLLEDISDRSRFSNTIFDGN